jgi:hypothetical protein
MAIQDALPSSGTPDGGLSTVPSRANKYSELFTLTVSNKEFGACAEGSYFNCVTPTPGTGIIGTASIAAITDVSPTMVIYNANPTKTLYPQYLNLHETVVSTSGARVQFTFYTDTINRYTSGGTLLTISNVNSASQVVSGAVIAVGAIVSPATTTKRLIDHVVFRGSIDVVEDQYEFIFGSAGSGLMTANRAATVGDFSKTLPPVGIAPLNSLVMHQWAGSQVNAPTYEYRLGFILR